jgi:hypothetical protein
MPVVIIIALVLYISSAPVESYYDYYLRYDGMSWVARRAIAVLINLKYGLYIILFVFMYARWSESRRIIIIWSLVIIAYELIYSYGSRIEALKIIMVNIYLYTSLVRRISVKKFVIYGLFILFLFSTVELIRSAMMGDMSISDYVLAYGIKPASELGAIYFSGFRLYELAAQGAIADFDHLMLIYDIVSLIPFVNFDHINPMVWFAKNYYPEALVPPYTMGPISLSAIFGGEFDMLIRAFLLGSFLALIYNVQIRKYGSWVYTSIYAFCFSTVVMVLKYDVFWYLPQIFKMMLPSVAVAWGVLFLLNLGRARNK